MKEQGTALSMFSRWYLKMTSKVKYYAGVRIFLKIKRHFTGSIRPMIERCASCCKGIHNLSNHEGLIEERKTLQMGWPPGTAYDLSSR
jgi:hypothetical protein